MIKSFLDHHQNQKGECRDELPGRQQGRSVRHRGRLSGVHSRSVGWSDRSIISHLEGRRSGDWRGLLPRSRDCRSVRGRAARREEEVRRQCGYGRHGPCLGVVDRRPCGGVTAQCPDGSFEPLSGCDQNLVLKIPLQQGDF